MAQPPPFNGWTDHGWGLEVTSPHQLFGIISNIALLEQSRTYAWRGQSNAMWRLSSSLFRYLDDDGQETDEDSVRAAELSILDEARRWGLGRDLGASATDMHLLAMLQHHGVPTRLIDVTSNPMTALWFALEDQILWEGKRKKRAPGVLFAIDVTGENWYETFQHTEGQTALHIENPLAASYEQALAKSAEDQKLFRAFPALPDERMRAQEGFFVGSAVPRRHSAPGVMGFRPNGSAPGAEKLKNLSRLGARTRGRPASVPFCAIVIPPAVKDKIREPLKRTYNRRRRVLFPDVDGFREGLLSRELD